MNFDTVPDIPLELGRYILETEDGTRGDVEIEPAGAGFGAEDPMALAGIGVFGWGTSRELQNRHS